MRLTDDDVAGLIKGLPRTEASRDFTSRVLEKLDRSRRRRSKRRAVVAVSMLVGLAGLGSWAANRYEESRAAARLEALRTEYRELESELQKLRALAAEIEPVLELGGTDEVDFVFDLREVDPQPPRAQPVSHERMR